MPFHTSRPTHRLHGIALCAALLLAATALHAQTGAVTGKVTDEDGKPVVGATVRLEGTKWGAKVKSDGTFMILDVAPDEYTIRITSVGFRPLVRKITVSRSDTTVVYCKLLTHPADSRPFCCLPVSPIRPDECGTVRIIRFDR